MIKVDKAKAIGMSLERVRAKRDAMLADLDKRYLIAQRTGGDTTALDAERQKLLDATEALKALDVDGDGLISVDEAASMICPLEDFEAELSQDV